MAMTVELPAALEQTDPFASRAKRPRLRRYARPALGLLLPVGLALIWELVVWRGWSNGRLLPPPTRVFATIVELARSGELTRHIVATLSRMAAGFGLGVIAGTVLGSICGLCALARRFGLGLEWMFVVAAELMGASEGLGYLLLDGQQLDKPAQILAAIVIFAVLGKATDWLIEIASAPFLRWQDAFRQTGAT